MICKVCHKQIANPKYHGLCPSCRSQRYEHSKQKRCQICGKLICNEATCCLDCASVFYGKKVRRKCTYCGNEYSSARTKKLKFCSSQCAYKYQSLRMKGLRRELSPSWKGSTTLESTGYVTAFDTHRRRRSGVHIQIAERILGRRLKKKEVVHHLNYCKSDNRNSNLLICSSSYHSWLHDQMAKAWAKEHLSG